MHIGLNAHLLSTESGYRAAGIHNVIHQLLRRLPQQAPPDWRFTAMVGSANQHADYAGITLDASGMDTRSPMRRIVWEQIVQPWQLGKYDLYHAMAFTGPVVLNVPMVVTVYDLTFLRYPERLSRSRRIYLQTMTRISCERARRIQVISESTGRDLVELMGIPEEKIDVTPLGYDRDRMQVLPAAEVAAFRQQKGLPERFWLFLGTLEPRKNLVMLIKAYAALPAEQRLPLILAGGVGWDIEPLHAAIDRYDLANSVFMPGFVPAEEIALWYNSAECFIYPSVFEGFGLPVLEAMACGAPVITSNVSSLPEVAGDAGLCLPPDQLEVWTNALRRAVEDSEWREETRQRGLERAPLFNWETTTRLTLESYRRAYEGK